MGKKQNMMVKVAFQDLLLASFAFATIITYVVVAIHDYPYIICFLSSLHTQPISVVCILVKVCPNAGVVLKYRKKWTLRATQILTSSLVA